MKKNIFTEILRYESIDSTQIKAKNLAEKNSSEGTVIIAQRQTQGYGRMRSNWSSEIGGLWFSFILRPNIYADEVVQIAPLIGAALHKVFEKELKIKTKIKWPNDILFNGKKVAGIIAEMPVDENKVKWVAAGVGINVNNVLDGEIKNTAQSLKDITGKEVCAETVFQSFLTEFSAIYLDFLKSGFKIFVDKYNKETAFLNSQVVITNGGEKSVGVYKGIDENANLLLMTKDGLKKFISGTLRPYLPD
ncbi:MAG: biotin--[acetyl-CoA-carboxylase] ligase [Elusimicrobiota bacterium]|jgi:BirA family biotin operon repressor/biotin-[acetyl-CoA-carboxylase] ligase|nr:biotin--[acetyl-CoA-carboxylase] ligase [Elusimicrobiota bacterium]